MPEKRIRVAIIGAGMIANAGHIPAWKNLAEDVELVGVFNRSIARAEHCGATWDSACFRRLCGDAGRGGT